MVFVSSIGHQSTNAAEKWRIQNSEWEGKDLAEGTRGSEERKGSSISISLSVLHSKDQHYTLSIKYKLQSFCIGCHGK